MTRFIALLRAVNVGGTGRLPIGLLTQLCVEAGFRGVRTFIASGNVVFDSKEASAEVKAKLERKLQAQAGAAIGVVVRTAEEMRDVLAINPFRDAPSNRTVAIFLDAPPPPGALQAARGRADEEIRLGAREIYVFYPRGQGASKLKIPAAATGTARNMNTIARLVGMALDA
jgi:uncharacterized protein (DUF1697 family)